MKSAQKDHLPGMVRPMFLILLTEWKIALTVAITATSTICGKLYLKTKSGVDLFAKCLGRFARLERFVKLFNISLLICVLQYYSFGITLVHCLHNRELSMASIIGVRSAWCNYPYLRNRTERGFL